MPNWIFGTRSSDLRVDLLDSAIRFNKSVLGFFLIWILPLAGTMPDSNEISIILIPFTRFYELSLSLSEHLSYRGPRFADNKNVFLWEQIFIRWASIRPNGNSKACNLNFEFKQQKSDPLNDGPSGHRWSRESPRYNVKQNDAGSWQVSPKHSKGLRSVCQMVLGYELWPTNHTNNPKITIFHCWAKKINLNLVKEKKL